jgi:hypothetical protein
MTIAPNSLMPSRSSRVGQAKGEPSMEASHASALELKHAGIERQIEDELSRPLPDDARLQSLKKRKLRIKEELART